MWPCMKTPRASTQPAWLETQSATWWKAWYSQVFNSLMHFPKWSTKHRNLRACEIVLVSYDNDHKYLKPTTGQAVCWRCRLTGTCSWNEAKNIPREVLALPDKELLPCQAPSAEAGCGNPCWRSIWSQNDKKPDVDGNMIQPMVVSIHVTHVSSSKSRTSRLNPVLYQFANF